MLAHCDTAQNGVADVQEMGYNELITHKVWMNWSMLVILSPTPSQMAGHLNSFTSLWKFKGWLLLIF